MPLPVSSGVLVGQLVGRCFVWIDDKRFVCTSVCRFVCVVLEHALVLTLYQDLYKRCCNPVHEQMWSLLAICDLGKVLAGRTMEGTSKPYVWLMCLFVRAIRGQKVWTSCIAAAMEPTNNTFRFSNYLTRSDEAFITLVLEAKGRQWSASIESTKKAAWDQLKASTRCMASRRTFVKFVCYLSLTRA